MYTVRLFDISLTRAGFVLFLSEKEDGPTLPIIIGISEAQSITMALNGIEPERPLTHDFFKSFMDNFGAKVTQVTVSRLEDNTFFADIHLKTRDDILIMDARPSDAIALAIRFKAPIYINDDVMQAAGTNEQQEHSSEDSHTTLAKANFEAKPYSELTELQGELQYAIENELFEDAANIRDRLNTLQNRD